MEKVAGKTGGNAAEKAGSKAAKEAAEEVAEKAAEKGTKKTASEAAGGVGKSGSNVVDDIFMAGKKTLDNFDINNAYVKPKHLSTSGGNSAKFLGETKEAAEEILRESIKNGTVQTIIDNGMTAMGNKSYQIIIDVGKKIGTKGETFVKIVISEDGAMLSAYPVKK